MNLLKIANSQNSNLSFCLGRKADLKSNRSGVAFVVAEETPAGFQTVYEAVIWSFQQLLELWFTARQTKNLYANLLNGNKHLARWMQPKATSIEELSLALQPLILPAKDKAESSPKNQNGSNLATFWSGIVETQTKSVVLKLFSFFHFPKHTGYRFQMNHASNKALDRNLRSFLASKLTKYPIYQDPQNTVFLTLTLEGILLTILQTTEAPDNSGQDRKHFDILIPAGERAETLNSFLNRSASPGQKNQADFTIKSNHSGIKFCRSNDQIFDVTFFNAENSFQLQLTVPILAALLLATESVDEMLIRQEEPSQQPDVNAA